MRKIIKITEKLRKDIESKLAIFVLLDYKYDDCKIAYEFSDGQLSAIIFE